MYRRLATLALVALLASLFLAACTGAASPPLQGVGESAQGQPPAGDQSGTGSPSQPGPNQAPADQPLIVHKGGLDLEVADLVQSVQQGNQLVAGLGGSVATSSQQNSANDQVAKVTYRVPAERWAEALAALKGVAVKVLIETTESEDVTGQVVDLDARIANLRVTEAALQGIMTGATTITDVLKVQTELTKVRGDIESMTAQRDLLANRAALGTLDVTYRVPVVASSVATGGWDLGREVDNATAALVRVGQSLASIAIWLLIVILPVVLPVFVIIYVAVRIRRRWVANRALQGPPTPSV